MSTIEFRVAFILDDFAKRAASEITKLFNSNFAAYIEELNKKQRHIDQLTKTLESYQGTVKNDDGDGVEYEAHSWVKQEPEELDNATTASITDGPGDCTRSESDFGAPLEFESGMLSDFAPLEFESGMLVSSQTQTGQTQDIMSSVPGWGKTESPGSDASGIEPSAYEETPHTSKKTRGGRRGGKTKRSTGRHVCSVCHKRFARATNLVQHRFDHKQEGLQLCCWCGAIFSSNSKLMAHIRSHTGNKDSTCSWCGKAFSSNATLKVHMRNMHMRKQHGLNSK